MDFSTFRLCSIEKAFYAGKGYEPEDSSESKKKDEEKKDDQEAMNTEQLAKLLANPEVMNMLKVISKSLGK